MALLVLVSISVKYINTNVVSPLNYCRTLYWIILIIPGLAAIASEHCNWTAPYYEFIYILNYNVINQRQGIAVLYLTILRADLHEESRQARRGNK
jgi:hypothetical protein